MKSVIQVREDIQKTLRLWQFILKTTCRHRSLLKISKPVGHSLYGMLYFKMILTFVDNGTDISNCQVIIVTEK